ncbi:unnamed protein product [Chondrus crispus]|uniref:Uncharacterized protein n=1 Tax=Chondrus crispus TaxID=2769 RepID=R7QK04_CHOCR|nr:unnamed protein product [Chondrus crispus]CDF38063.1 unnamed protein product [Chondrus crispus]|eukprot:XP_005717932.1 unnamed protein product [Chondrus crispus]
MLFGLTGGLIAPALLSALAGVGVASAAGLAASGTLASGAVVGGLFGVAGAGFTVKKARNRVSTNLEEFDFERPDDPRVVDTRKKKAERERLKMEKLIAQRLREEAEAAGVLAIEDAPEKDSKAFDPEKELPHPPSLSEDEFDDEAESKKHRRFGSKKKKKRQKLKVGSRGLEAASHFPSLHVCICVPSWLTDRSFGAALDQFEPALKQELPASQHIALRWESRRLYEMGLAFAKFWASKATVTTVQQAYPHAVAAASSVAGAVAFAFAMPLTIMSCMDYVDNPWSILVSRSNGAGEELADVLVERSYGKRPVSLFGYSIGARVVFKCLESLAERGALGIVDNIYVMGAAVTADPERWKKIRPVVAGRIVNAYGSYDWALAFFHRGCGHGVYVSGLRRVELEGVENLNMSYLGIEGHRELKDCVPRVMKAMGLGLGYIIMPPARLVRRRGRRRSKTRGDSPVCEEPKRLDKSEKAGSSSSSPSENGSNQHLNGMRNDRFWKSESPEDIAAETELEIDQNLSLPPNVESQAPSDRAGTLNEGTVSIVDMAVIDGEKLAKKKKSKSWLSWNAWTGHSSKSSSKSKSKKLTTEEARSEELHGTGQDAVTANYLQADLPSEDARLPRIEESGPTMNDPYSSTSQRDDQYASTNTELDNFDEDDVGLPDDDDENEEEFDWEKQRRIWEEQERQIQERGFADSAAEIEMSHKMILGVGIEVAGRRIHGYLEQDADLPVAKKEELFTNCLEDQRGVVVRIYEHEKRTKSVSLNNLKSDEQYPKLLGELELKLRESAVKGKLRIAVAMSTCENGDVYAEAEERFPDGSIGDKTELLVRRAELCTMAERTRLEAAERKRIEAQLQKELRIRAGPEALALPPAAETSIEISNEKNRPEIEEPEFGNEKADSNLREGGGAKPVDGHIQDSQTPGPRGKSEEDVTQAC